MAMRLTITERGVGAIQRSLRGLEIRTGRAVSNATGKLAHDLRKEIVTGIRSQAPGGIHFKPLAPSTIARKKNGSKALIDQGDLIRSINVTKLGDLAFFVGVHRSVQGKAGKPMWNLAEIHEFGSKKKPNRPPARPFLIPSYKAWRYDAEKQWAILLGRELGIPNLGGARASIGNITGKVTFGGGGEGGD